MKDKRTKKKNIQFTQRGIVLKAYEFNFSTRVKLIKIFSQNILFNSHKFE